MMREKVAMASSHAMKGTMMTGTLMKGWPLVVLFALAVAVGLPGAGVAQTVERMQAAGKIVFGYDADARPFSFTDEGGAPAGFAITLCSDIAEGAKAATGRADLAVEWVALPAADVLSALREGRVDLFCTPVGQTLSRMAEVSFSLPVFPGGTGAAVRSDAPVALREILTRDAVPTRPIWRGSPARTFLQEKTFAVVDGTIAADWLAGKVTEFKLASKTLPVKSNDEGITALLDGKADVFFGNMPAIIDAASRNPRSGELLVLPRHFTFEPMAMAFSRGDEDFRLIVDRSLSQTFAAPGFADVVGAWFGAVDPELVSFFRQAYLPD